MSSFTIDLSEEEDVASPSSFTIDLAVLAQDPEPVSNKDRSSRRGRRGPRPTAARDDESAHFEELQRQFGDESTILKSGRGQSRRLDRDELERRYYIDKVGFEPPGSGNPLVHLGKYANDLKYGTRQLFGLTTTGEDQNWKENEQLWNAADHPMSGTLGGMALMAAPTIAASPLTALGGGALASKFGASTLSNFLKRYSTNAISRGTGTMPAITGATLGAVEAGLAPVDADLPKMDRLGVRAQRAALGATIGGAIDLGAHGVVSKTSRSLTNKMKEKMSEGLPAQVDVPTPALWGNPEGMNLINKYSPHAGGQTKVTSRTSSASEQIRRFEDSLQENINLINERASGSTNTTIGERMKVVLDDAQSRFNISKRDMDAAYDAVKNHGNGAGYGVEYDMMLSNAVRELDDNFVPIEGRTASALKLMESLKTNKAAVAGTNHPVQYDIQQLPTIYKRLNNLKIDAEGSDIAGIGIIQENLDRLMSNGRFTGDAGALDSFKQANNMARIHYQKFTGDPTLDKFLVKRNTSRNTPSDVSNKIFGSGMLDAAEGPKVNTVEKLLGINPQYIKDLRNEAFANMTKKQGVQNADQLGNYVEMYVTSGRRSGLYDSIFDEKTLNQLGSLKDIVDTVNSPAPNTSLNRWGSAAAFPMSPMRALEKSIIGGKSFGELNEWSNLTKFEAGLPGAVSIRGNIQRPAAFYEGMNRDYLNDLPWEDREEED